MLASFYENQLIAVTGASSGLGAEFARQLAPKAKKLILTARREELLHELSVELRGLYPALEIEIITADLSVPSSIERLCQLLQSAGPDLLINNAGVGDYGRFETSAAEKNQTLLQVNIQALTRLSHAVLSGVRPVKGILHVSSLAASMPIPEFAIYAASKAYVTSFSEALRLENLRRGVHVTAMCPGPVPTEFGAHARRALDADLGFAKRDLIAVSAPFAVSKALHALARNRARVFPGFRVWLTAHFLETLPKPILRWFLARTIVGNQSHTPSAPQP